jgi:hypothetical protein
MVVRTAVRNVLLPKAHGALRALVARIAAAFAQPPDTIVVHETNANGVRNKLYDATQLYDAAPPQDARCERHCSIAAGQPHRVGHIPRGHPRPVGIAVRGVERRLLTVRVLWRQGWRLVGRVQLPSRRRRAAAAAVTGPPVPAPL